jgi:galactokinase
MKAAFVEKFQATFGRQPEFLARAPGRIEFIGNHTDYNGGTVLGASIDRAVWVGLARRTDGRSLFASDRFDGIVTLPPGPPARHSGAAAWTNYPVGVLEALVRFGWRVPEGFDYLAMSDVPVGAGLSSSAALELASGLVFLDAAGERPALEALVKACRSAENSFVGVPCGILDQAVSGFGRKDHLVFIDCRGPSFSVVPLPAGANFWIFNTHTKHALVDGLYAARNRECLDAARMLGAGLLADVKPEMLAAFASRKGGSLSAADTLLFNRAQHVVGEIARVDAAVIALRSGDLAAVGRLLTASHRSSKTLFENSTPELDFLAEKLAATPEVHGARLTGGGFGGAVMAVTTARFGETQAESVASAYQGRFGARPDVLHALTSDGAQNIPASFAT